MKGGHPLFFWLSLLLISTFFCGCDDDGDSSDESVIDGDNADDDALNADDDETSDPAETGICDTHVISAGFGLGWEKLNHRISLWEIYPYQPGCPAITPDMVDLYLGYIGGDFTTGEVGNDTPFFNYDYYSVASQNNIGFRSFSVEFMIGPDPDEQERTVTLIGNDFQADVPALVLISGISIETGVLQTDPQYPVQYDPALGYTVHGFGAWAREATPFDGGLEAVIWARFEPGPADRHFMNLATESAQVKFVVHCTALSLRSGAFTTAQSGYRLTYPPPHFLIPQNIEHADPDERRLEIQGEPGFSTAFTGLIGFDFLLFQDIENGDYIREISVSAPLSEYDIQTGRAVLDVDGYASNASLLTYETMDTDFSAEVALVQLPEGRVTFNHIRDDFQTGWWEDFTPSVKPFAL